MPVKITVTGTLDGEIRQHDKAFFFEVACKASTSAPKGLPLPSDAVTTVICNEKQVRPCREMILAGDKVICQGELCLDVSAKLVHGELAVVAFSLSTVQLEAARKAAQAEGASEKQEGS